MVFVNIIVLTRNSVAVAHASPNAQNAALVEKLLRMLHSPTRKPKKKKICQHEKSKTLLERYPRAASLLLSQSFLVVLQGAFTNPQRESNDQPVVDNGPDCANRLACRIQTVRALHATLRDVQGLFVKWWRAHIGPSEFRSYGVR